MRLTLQPRILAVLTLTLVWSSAVVADAEASFPGRNGVIAVSRVGPHDESTLWVINPRNGSKRQLTHVSRGCTKRYEWTDSDPSFSASGRLIAYYHSDYCDPSTATANGIYVMGVEGGGGNLVRPEREGEILELPAFSPSGELLAFDDYLETTFVTHVQPPHRARQLRLRSGRSRFDEIIHPAWSLRGKLALTLGDDLVVGAGHIGIVSANGGGRVRLVTHSRRDVMPDWSPTAHRIVFNRLTERRGDSLDANVLVASAVRHGQRRPQRLTGSLDTFFPVWSPDGRRIAYVRSSDYIDFEDNNGSLWTMRAADGGAPRLIAHGVIADRISWQPRPRR